jgi:L-rhamnose-H+ transport protein
VAWGIALIILAGIFNGIFAYPMKLARGWNWEHIWLVFAVTGLLILPAAVGFSTVPDLWTIYARLPRSTLLVTFLLGIAWGGGSLLFGLGVSALGLALANAILMGTTAVLGTLIPALLSRMDAFGSVSGLALLASLVLVVLGLALCAVAGMRRDRLAAGDYAAAYSMGRRGSFAAGLLTCVAGGALSACFNIGFAATGNIRQAAQAAGAGEVAAGFAVWTLIMSAGSLPSLIYCAALLRRNRSLPLFHKRRRNWLFGLSMTAMWILALALYGAGAGQVGALGATVGWPILVSTAILAANLLGLLTAEWQGVSRRVLLLLCAGLGMLVSAVVLASTAGV